jgi:AraC-like DNA-binding protein
MKSWDARKNRQATLPDFNVGHYHQPKGRPVNPKKIDPGTQYIELVTAGRGWVRNGETWQEVTPGSLLWLLPGDFTIGRSDFENPYQCLAVRFPGPRRPRRVIPLHTRWDEVDEVRRFTAEVVRLHAGGRFDAGVLLDYILGRLRFQAELFLRQESRQQVPEQLRRALQRIDTGYGGPLRLQDLAEPTGWSVAHFHDVFRQHLGLSPHQALLQRRIEAAREMLAGGNDPVKSIAADCGFSSPSAFCALFKKTNRLSPQEYRRRQLSLGR